MTTCRCRPFTRVAPLALLLALAVPAPAATPAAMPALFDPAVAADDAERGHLRLRPEAVTALRAARGDVLLHGLPLPDGTALDLRLRRFTVTGPHTRFVLGTRGGADAPFDFDPARIVLLRGEVPGAPGSRAFLAVTDGGVLGTVALGAGQPRYVLGPAAPGARGFGRDGAVRVVESSGFGGPLGVEPCGLDTADLAVGGPGGISGGPVAGLRELQIALETDYEYYSIFGDAVDAGEYLVALYGAISDVYQRDVGTRIELSYVRLWNNPADLFNDPDPLVPFRDFWNQNMNAVTRDVAQLVTGRVNLPYGGVAWLSSLCGDSAYSVAGYIIGSFAGIDTPAFGNWDLVVCAHELGHNCGALHTHDYGIDNCASGEVRRGTIMSYCHTTAGGNANMDLRFHAFVQGEIEAYAGAVTCVIDDCNANGVADLDDLTAGTSPDANDDGVPDECQDCNGNGTLDPDDIAGGSPDLNGNGVPDDCEPDCNANGVPDDLDIASGSPDLYGDGVPDECQADCNDNGIADYNEIQQDMSLDLDRNAVLDACQDCDGDGILDADVLGGALNVWIAGFTLDAVREFHASSGVQVRTSDAGAIDQAQDLVVAPNGLILVSSAAGNRIVEFDPADGSYRRDLVASGAGGLSQPAGLAFDAGGALLVASRGTDSILRYDAVTGAFLGAHVAPGAGGLVAPFGLYASDDGRLLVTTGDDRVLEFDLAGGAFVREVIFAGSGGLSDPRGLVLKSDGRLLVASYDNDRILEYAMPSGWFLRRFDTGGAAGGFWALARPWTLRRGVDGYIYVSTRLGNTAIQRYDEQTGLFKRSYYVLSSAMPAATGFDFIPPSTDDCNRNLRPDACEIADGSLADVNDNGVPDVCEELCAADVNDDQTVNTTDLLLILALWGTGDPDYDIAPAPDGDGIVNTLDLLALRGLGAVPGVVSGRWSLVGGRPSAVGRRLVGGRRSAVIRRSAIIPER